MQPTAAIILIGNEILSGRTQDKNLNYIATSLTDRGIRLMEVRVIPDLRQTIIDTVQELAARFDYLFTTGGIGPTHDDITSEAIAAAFSTPLEENPDALAMLEHHYKESKTEFTPSRRKMAKIPRGAELIYNPVSAAPGFILKNVYVMAGVPRICQAMMDQIAPSLQGGQKLLSRTVSSNVPEGDIAELLETLEAQYNGMEIGSYPFLRSGKLGTSAVIRSTEKADIDAAAEQIIAFVQERKADIFEMGGNTW